MPGEPIVLPVAALAMPGDRVFFVGLTLPEPVGIFNLLLTVDFLTIYLEMCNVWVIFFKNLLAFVGLPMAFVDIGSRYDTCQQRVCVVIVQRLFSYLGGKVRVAKSRRMKLWKPTHQCEVFRVAFWRGETCWISAYKSTFHCKSVVY